MAITAAFIKNIMAEARPIIERQMEDAKLIAGFRTVVANAGGDWGALKALIKAHVEDENDETGDGQRVQKIRDKADSTSAYADMLGLAKMNEENFSSRSYAEEKGTGDVTIVDRQDEDGNHIRVTVSPEIAEILARGEADPETGEITDNQEQSEKAQPLPAQESGGTALDASHGGKSNAARPASVDAHVNDGGLAGEVSDEVVTVVGDESGTLTDSHSQAIPSKPADMAEEVSPSRTQASSATLSDDIDLTIPEFLRRTEGGYPKREAEEA